MRHDNGGQYMADVFQSEIAFLGIESSQAFLRASEGNGCAERFIRTLKENLLWIRTLPTLSRSCRRRYSTSGTLTTPPGPSSDTATKTLEQFVPKNFSPWSKPHRLQHDVSQTAGGT